MSRNKVVISLLVFLCGAICILIFSGLSPSAKIKPYPAASKSQSSSIPPRPFYRAGLAKKTLETTPASATAHDVSDFLDFYCDSISRDIRAREASTATVFGQGIDSAGVEFIAVTFQSFSQEECVDMKSKAIAYLKQHLKQDELASATSRVLDFINNLTHQERQFNGLMATCGPDGEWKFTHVANKTDGFMRTINGTVGMAVGNGGTQRYLREQEFTARYSHILEIKDAPE